MIEIHSELLCSTAQPIVTIKLRESTARPGWGPSRTILLPEPLVIRFPGRPALRPFPGEPFLVMARVQPGGSFPPPPAASGPPGATHRSAHRDGCTVRLSATAAWGCTLTSPQSSRGSSCQPAISCSTHPRNRPGRRRTVNDASPCISRVRIRSLHSGVRGTCNAWRTWSTFQLYPRIVRRPGPETRSQGHGPSGTALQKAQRNTGDHVRDSPWCSSFS